MIIKTMKITLNALVALSVLCAAVMLAIATWHVLVVGGVTVYHLMHS